ncbi:MAG TPA: hypothetical protein VHW01_02245, partial [Polyangiaceae bacterium]|nr:hypothetical protein [Polyangiaceae bacterium]
MARALNLSLEKRRRESGRKYLRGQRPLSDGTLAAIVRACVADGYLPDGVSPLIVDGLSLAIANWDHVIGHADARPGETVAATATRYLRLVAIDVALRAAAIDMVEGVLPPPPQLEDSRSNVPVWAREHGVRDLLRGLPKALGTKRAALGKRFEELFDSRSRPSNTKLRQLAAVLRTHNGHDAWHMHLVWAIALDALCNQLAVVVGRDVVEEIAGAFRRIRTNTRTVLLEVHRQHPDDDQVRGAIARLIVAGARAPSIDGLMDILARCETRVDEMLVASSSATGEHLPSPEELTRRVAWATDLRASRADWLLAQVEVVARTPVPIGKISIGTQRRIARALRVGADPGELAAACDEPSAALWVARVLVQRAFVRGDFEHVLPMVARFADVACEPGLNFEAAIIHLAAGRLDAAQNYLHAIGTAEPFATAAKPFIAIAHALSGREDALQRLNSLRDDDAVFAYARGVALRGVGRSKEALAIFESILAERPKHALACEQAVKCCDDMAALARGSEQAK